MTRIYTTLNRSSWPTAPRPSFANGAIVVFFPGLDLHPELKNLSPGDNVVREVRFSKVSGGVQMHIICQPGLAPRFSHVSEKDAYYIEIERPAPLRPRPQIAPDELRRLKAQGVKIVILDPGHGGRDPGTRGHGMIEKEEVLEISRLLQKTLDRNGQGRVRAFLTRTGDYNLSSLYDDSLRLRLAKAVELQGDLFLSVHLNQFRQPSVSGWEIHVPESYTGSRLARTLGQNPDAIGEHIVAGELAADDSELKRFLLTQAVSHMEEHDFSRQWADVLAGELGRLSEIPSRGIRISNKFVTGNLGMPSVLLEIGFLSNAADARAIRSERFRERLATNVSNAVLKYFFGSGSGLATAPAPPVRVTRAAPSAAPTPKSPPKPTHHKVKKNETASEIAQKYGVSVNALLRANQLTPRTARRLQVGQNLRIP